MKNKLLITVICVLALLLSTSTAGFRFRRYWRDVGGG